MRKFGLTSLLFSGVALIAAATASARPLSSVAASQLPVIQAGLAAYDESADTGGGIAAVTTVYDNWTAPPTVLRSVFVAGTDEIADDLTFPAGMPAGAGLLSNCGFNLANANGPAGSALTGGQMAVRFYRLDDGNFIGGFNANLPALNLGPGGSARLQFADGALESINILIPTSGVYMSLQVNTLTGTGGFTTANAGYQTRSPNAVGSSTDNLYNVTLGGTPFNFGGTPIANTGLHIKTNDVPEPAGLALLGLGALALRRRR